MPIYSYICTSCDYRFTKNRKLDTKCPYCGNDTLKENPQNGAEKLLQETHLEFDRA